MRIRMGSQIPDNIWIQNPGNDLDQYQLGSQTPGKGSGFECGIDSHIQGTDLDP